MYDVRRVLYSFVSEHIGLEIGFTISPTRTDLSRIDFYYGLKSSYSIVNLFFLFQYSYFKQICIELSDNLMREIEDQDKKRIEWETG